MIGIQTKLLYTKLFMKKSSITKMPAFFDRYIHLVDDVDLLEALRMYHPTSVFADLDKLNALNQNVYLPGKWTVRTILQHLIDTERIMNYRALRFARKDTTLLPGFDEDFFAKNSAAEERSIEELLQEYALVRESTLALFASFTDTMLKQKGETFVGSITVLAVGFMIVGHGLHHRKVLNERYLPLLEEEK